MLPVLSFSLTSAWAQAEACADIVQQALAAIAENCADLARDSLCYAHAPVDVSHSAAAADFSQPADRLPLRGLRRAQTGPLSLDDAAWGVAFLNLGANSPQTYAGPGVLVLLAGAAEIQNQIDPAQLMEIGPALSTVALANATRYRNPGVIPEPVGQLAGGELLLVDAYDSSGEWLRVVTDGAISWVESDKLARLQAMATLPKIRLGQVFPLQSFSLWTGSAAPECQSAEPMVAVQTPPALPANLTVNGVDIHIDSLVTFQRVHPSALSLTVHRGKVTTVFGGIAQVGESIIGVLEPTDARESAVLDWSDTLAASEAELARGERAQAAFNQLARVNGWQEREAHALPAEIVHIIQSGDSLHSVAQQYDASVAEIVAANETGAPLRLFPGEELIVPNPGRGFAGMGTGA